MDQFGLAPAANRKFGGYSKGMKRKLTIAAGIIHRPEILFLDEPTSGIDVRSARQLHQRIADLHRAETTIFLTTHSIEEAERLCGRIAFILPGRRVRTETVDYLLRSAQEKQWMRIPCLHLSDDLIASLPASFPALEFMRLGRERVQVEAGGPVPVAPLVRFLEDRGTEVLEARKVRPSLEDVFVQITGIEVDGMQKEKERSGGGS